MDEWLNDEEMFLEDGEESSTEQIIKGNALEISTEEVKPHKMPNSESPTLGRTSAKLLLRYML